eukprot:gene23505-28508_t
MNYIVFFILCLAILSGVAKGVSFLGEYPSGCDTSAALQCEYEFLLCKLFNGPANDAVTMCNCGTEFYGSCIRRAGCETSREVGALSNHEIYMKVCVDFIMENNCPNSLICSINCASDGNIDTATTKIIPFNNYGQYHLRIKPCVFKVHEKRLQRYSMIDQVACKTLDEYQVCARFIPPSTYTPVALPINTTYIEIDSCTLTNGVYKCTTDPPPVRVYGNKLLFPTSYDVQQNALSICATDNDCLGSFCDVAFVPPICSPKTIRQALGPGKDYMSTV